MTTKPTMFARIASGCLVLICATLVMSTARSQNHTTVLWYQLGYVGSSDFEALATTLNSHPVFYAGTFGDGVFRSEDNGATWITATTGITLPLYVNNALAVSPITPTTVFVGDYYGGGVYRSLDSGEQWEWVLPDLAARALLVHPITPTVVLAGDREAGLWRSSDGGESWAQITATLSSTHVMAFAAEPLSGTVYMGAGSYVGRSLDAGLTWEPLDAFSSTVQTLAVHPITSTMLYAGTFSNGVYRSLDGGTTWENSSQGLPANAWITSLAIAPTPPGVIYAGAWNGEVYRSLDQGVTWEGLGYLGNVYAILVHPAAPSVLYAGTANNGLFRGSTLDHLTIEPLASPQHVRRPFEITLTARDALGFPLIGTNPLMLASITDARLAQTLAAGGYMGTATLVDTTGTLTPTQVALVDGVAVVPVTVSDEAYGVTITATLPEGVAITSNPFDVIWAARLFLPLVWK